MLRQQGLRTEPAGPEINAKIQGRISGTVAAMLREPETAMKFVKGEVQIPGLSSQENDAVRRLVKKQVGDVLAQKYGESSSVGDGMPRTAPIKTKQEAALGQITEQYGDQYTQAKQEQQARERAVERKQANDPYRQVFGTEDQLSKQTPLAKTAEELQGQRTVDPLNDAEIRPSNVSAFGPQDPNQPLRTRFIEGDNSRTVRQTAEGIEEEIHSLRNKLDALRETGVVQKNTIQNTGTNSFGDTAEVQKLREQLKDAKDRLRQANDNGGVYLHRPKESRGDEYGRVISRVAEPEQQPQAQRVKGDFRLFSKNIEPEPTAESVGRKLDNVLARDDLAPETRTLLERSEPLLKSDEHLAMLDEQFDRVLNGEGLGGTKAVQEGEKIVARPQGEAATPLTYGRELGDAIKLREQVAQEGVQKPLFDQKTEVGKAAGAVFTSPKQFAEHQKKTLDKLEAPIRKAIADQVRYSRWFAACKPPTRN
jgi:hypothetical protein